MCIFQSSRVSKLKFMLTEMELGHAERRRVEEVSKLFRELAVQFNYLVVYGSENWSWIEFWLS